MAQQLELTARAPRALVVDDDANIRHVVAALLELDGYRYTVAASGDEAVRSAQSDPPDLILLDLTMPGMSGGEALKALRSDHRTRHIPIIMLTARSSVDDRVGHLRAGADDYVTKPFDAGELLARARGVLERSELLSGLNPITRLPGNAEIAHEIERRLASRRPFACLYADLDRFKSYNDHYGFVRGDAVIKLLGDEMVESVNELAAGLAFIGHVGGDDFIVLTTRELAEPLAAHIAGRFDDEIPLLYDLLDRERGWIESPDRAGETRRTPFVTVSIGIVLVERGRFANAAELARTAAEVKEAAKRESGSSWVVDRRDRRSFTFPGISPSAR